MEATSPIVIIIIDMEPYSYFIYLFWKNYLFLTFLIFDYKHVYIFF